MYLFYILYIVLYKYNIVPYIYIYDFPGGSVVKNLPVMYKAQVRSLDWEDPLGKGKVTHSSILLWKIP